jgi:hypothetical protein
MLTKHFCVHKKLYFKDRILYLRKSVCSDKCRKRLQHIDVTSRSHDETEYHILVFPYVTSSQYLWRYDVVSSRRSSVGTPIDCGMYREYIGIRFPATTRTRSLFQGVQTGSGGPPNRISKRYRGIISRW